MKKLIAATILIVMLTSACQTAGTPTAAPTAGVTAVPPTSTPAPALFSDDFSGSQLDWASFGMVAMQPKLLDGSAHFSLAAASSAVAAATGKTFPEDVVVESDVTISDDAGSHVFGIACRLEPTFNGKAYLFYVAKFSADTGRVAGISIYDPTTTQAPNLVEQALTGDLAETATLHLQAQCIGSKLFLSINGQNVTGVNDTQLTSGVDAGMFAYGDGSGGEVVFDNFTVLAPTADQSAAARLPTLKAP